MVAIDTERHNINELSNTGIGWAAFFDGMESGASLGLTAVNDRHKNSTETSIGKVLGLAADLVIAGGVAVAVAKPDWFEKALLTAKNVISPIAGADRVMPMGKWTENGIATVAQGPHFALREAGNYFDRLGVKGESIFYQPEGYVYKGSFTRVVLNGEKVVDLSANYGLKLNPGATVSYFGRPTAGGIVRNFGPPTTATDIGEWMTFKNSAGQLTAHTVDAPLKLSESMFQATGESLTRYFPK